MTDSMNAAEGLPSSSLLVVEAFADGERVDPDVLVDALADPAVREHLVQLLLLREAVSETLPSTPRAGGRARRRASRARWLPAAAAILLSLAVGYAAGQRSLEPLVEASAVQTVVQIDQSPPPPAPTHVITLQPGINWTEYAGER